MSSSTPTLAKPALQSYDFFLVLDVEATCQEKGGKNYPNEIIEWPVCLLGWRDKAGGILDIISEFRSFVKPTWRPELSKYCIRLTGITQDQADNAPPFPEVMGSMAEFLVTHGILNKSDHRPLVRFCWCTDGPYDICSFVIKQCFISKLRVPPWISNRFIDVRVLLCGRDKKTWRMTIGKQLQVLQLEPFIGRPHSGIDDARNISRVLIELARRGKPLSPTTSVNVRTRYNWMGKAGKIIEAEL